MRKTLLVLLVILLAGLLWLALDVRRSVYRPPSGFQPKTIVIPAGASVNRIARILEHEKVISRATYFYWYYRLFFRSRMLKSGEYSFDKPLTMRQVIEKLAAGRVVLEKFTVREGLTIKEIAKNLDDAQLVSFHEFLAAAWDVTLIRDLDREAEDLEGYLFPDTYMLRKGMSGAAMVSVMVSNFKKHFPPALIWRCREIQFNVRQAVILASLIEKETSSAEERFLISSVFHNRLRRGMSLDCDPTIIYALERNNLYTGKLGWEELKYDSPYNTRLHRGLPPGPIGNPGKGSIEAALYPATSNYLFFVSKDGHLHHFSESLQEHNRAVQKYIIQHNAGKSR